MRFGSIPRSMIPASFRRKIRSLQRRLRWTLARTRKVLVGRADISRALVDLGIRSGDVAFVHSSLTAFGHVEGGPDAVIDAVFDAVGPAGTVLMPTYVPTGDWIEYARSGVIFEPTTAPSTVGKITEVFRQRPGVLRSLHPTHSTAGFGHLAEEFLADHHTSPTPCGPGSPLWKLVHEGGKVVHLGSPFGSMTVVHPVEDEMEGFPIDPYLPEVFHMPIRHADGSVEEVDVRIHDPALVPIRIDHDQEKSNEFYGYAEGAGVVRTGKVGNATIHVIDAPAFHRLLGELAAKGITIYNTAAAR